MKGFEGRKVFSMVFLSWMLSGCVALAPNSSINTKYRPGGKEVFVIDKAIAGRKGVNQFCTEKLISRCTPISTFRYLGTKGYFTLKAPVVVEKGHLVFPIILDTGEFYYYYQAPNEPRYSEKSPIKLVSNAVENIRSPPLIVSESSLTEIISDSPLKIVGDQKNIVQLTNGFYVSKERINKIRLLANLNPKVKRVLPSLIRKKISYDDIDKQFFISLDKKDSGTYLRLYLGVKEDQVWIRQRLQYMGPRWLFVDSYTVAADDYRWGSGVADFDRDNSSSNVWEWVDQSVDDSSMKALLELSKSTKSVIRFRGKHTNHDLLLSDTDKAELKEIIDIYKSLK